MLFNTLAKKGRLGMKTARCQPGASNTGKRQENTLIE
jgi:hypothetical protein